MMLLERGRRRSSRAPRRSSSAARTCSASRWRSCCSSANATVTICHSRTRDLPAVVPPRRRADRRGRPRRGWSARDWVKPGRGRDRRRHQPHRRRARRRRRLRRGRPRSPARSRRCPAASGPMTIAMLLRNTLQAARAAGRRERRRGLRRAAPRASSLAGARRARRCSSLLFLDWFVPVVRRGRRASARASAAAARSSGWTSLGWLALVLLARGSCAALALAVATRSPRSVAAAGRCRRGAPPLGRRRA